ncbi:MAG: hypothetical protein N5P05_000630 [Chroococcopsis gigantea SAG 12.99]|jgi:diguanylate cyclase (GGDEF)-like protein/PAS domain S-box-containing protein|nr:hypothetical protein [Chroococcopsis gigantea SAG 12.99]
MESAINLPFLFQYIPHGHCYLWQTPLVGLHLASDILIGVSYYSIPASLLYFVRKRADIPFEGIFLLFSAFILLCGTTHFVAVWTLWNPSYWVSGGIKAATALVSVYTALELIPLIPRALSLPDPKELETLNNELANQISERKMAEEEVRQLNTELELRVQERTADLEQANTQLQLEIAEREQMEMALRISKLFTEQIIHLTPNIIYIFDLEKLRNIYVNPFLTEILGYTLPEIQEMDMENISSFIHPEDRESVKYHLQRCRHLTGGSFLEVEYRMKNSQGVWCWLHSRNTVFTRSNDGQTQQIIGIASDITNRKITELKLQDTNNLLAERISELEARTRNMIRLGEMTDYLQSCLNVSEAEQALGDLLKPLFPYCSGAVYMNNILRDTVETVAVWGEVLNSEHFFQAEECWALRRGATHQGDPKFSSLYCGHIHFEAEARSTLCIPMMAQGESLGLLYLCFQDPEVIAPDVNSLAETVSKQIAISLANLKLRETLQYHSISDALTGLFNRRYLESSLNRELNRAARMQQSIGIIMLDIDHFKLFNDTYGHDAGDMILKTIAEFIKSNVRECDIACRYGGEELIVILPNASLKITLARAEQLRGGIKNLAIQTELEQTVSVTASFGVAAYPNHARSKHHLLKAADEALYRAKEQGRDRVICSPVNGDELPD